MKKLIILILIFCFSLACEGDRGPTGPQGPPGEVVNHAPVIMALVVDWRTFIYDGVVEITVNVSVIDKDGDDLVVTVKATAEYPDGQSSRLRTMICTPSDYTPGEFSGYLNVDIDEMATFRRIRFECLASDGQASSQNNPIYYLNVQ